MKRTKLKRKGKLKRSSHSELRKLITKADRALQDFYRWKYKGTPCESCGKPFELAHHFIEKSRSTYLRFRKINLIFICNSCHSLHHQFHDSSVHARIIKGRGIKWLDRILKLKGEHMSLTKKVAEEMCEKYGRI